MTNPTATATARTDYLIRLVEAEREFAASLQELRTSQRRLGAAQRGLVEPGRRSTLSLANLSRIELDHEAALSRLRNSRREAYRLLELPAPNDARLLA